MAEVEVTFGSMTLPGVAVTTVVTGQPWVVTGMLLVASSSGGSTTDRVDGGDAAIDGVHGYVTTVVDGVGFTLVAFCVAPTHGKFKFSVIGV